MRSSAGWPRSSRVCPYNNIVIIIIIIGIVAIILNILSIRGKLEICLHKDVSYCVTTYVSARIYIYIYIIQCTVKIANNIIILL